MKRNPGTPATWPWHRWWAALLLTAPLLAPAQDPSRCTIALVVGYAAGGSVDMVARTVAAPLSQRLGQPVRVENIAGASGTIAAARVALADPDGCTLLLGSPSEVGINHLLSRHGHFDPRKDLTPIGLVGSQPMVLVASRQVPVRSVDDFLAYAQAHPGRARYATSGPGTPLHLAGETIRLRTGLALQHQPYRGAGPMLPDLLDGHVEFAVMVLSSALAPVREGRLRALGVTSAGRAPNAPEIPALAEHPRLRGLDLGVWFGLLGPAKLPRATADRLQAALRESLKQPAVRQRLQQAGLVMMEDTPFDGFLRDEVQKFEGVIAAARLRE